MIGSSYNHVREQFGILEEYRDPIRGSDANPDEVKQPTIWCPSG